MVSEEILGRLTNDFTNRKACAICVEVGTSKDVNGEKVLIDLDKQGWVGDRLVKLAQAYENDRFSIAPKQGDADLVDASLSEYLENTVRFMANDFLSEDEIEANLALEKPVPFVSNILNDEYEVYVSAFHAKYYVELAREMSGEEPTGPSR